MDDSLAVREKLLKAREESAQGKTDVVAVRLDIIGELVRRVDSDDELKKIFGEPVSGKLALVTDSTEFTIADAMVAKIDEGQKIAFLKRLRALMAETLEKSGISTYSSR